MRHTSPQPEKRIAATASVKSSADACVDYGLDCEIASPALNGQAEFPIINGATSPALKRQVIELGHKLMDSRCLRSMPVSRERASETHQQQGRQGGADADKWDQGAS